MKARAGSSTDLNGPARLAFSLLLLIYPLSPFSCRELKEYQSEYRKKGEPERVKWDMPPPEDPLYEILFSYDSIPPLREAQMLRHILWFEYMDLSGEQLRILSGCAKDFREMKEDLETDLDRVMRGGGETLSPLYRELLHGILSGEADERELSEKGMKINILKMELELAEEYRKKKVEVLKAMLERTRDFLATLSPIQEKKLVTSLFFLRRELDPLTSPGEYQEIIGRVWNPGDYSILSRLGKERFTKELDIGNLWGIKNGLLEGENVPDYSNIQRKVLGFMIIKDPLLPESIEAYLAPAMK